MARQDVFRLDALRAYFEDVDFPCQRDDLMHAARTKDASDPFMRALEELPKHAFKDVEEVHQFLNGELDMEKIERRSGGQASRP
ncbi:MAG: DUF2795 domain-containing protein [Bradymonadaceae bacterium]